MEGMMVKDDCLHCYLIAQSMVPWKDGKGWERHIDPDCPIHGKLASKEVQDRLLKLLGDNNNV